MSFGAVVVGCVLLLLGRTEHAESHASQASKFKCKHALYISNERRSLATHFVV